ncbi:hypothetical protein Riv7116_3413 [Rivularia sp. PCC 7116]|uniref:hypothetical protein n=1 Tax=Rivularia sp. PCC 7116 TaxID=373994 RepID=UPI00029ED61C|nr:hypothetical protein [Rivularia sp. PCC 7116]AFY55869.1 hypothetical protein Riv7116_3413 [Rivularia sp. PCC 7116]
MDAQNIFQALTSADALRSLIFTLISMGIGAFITYKFLFFIYRKEMKLFRNFKRKLIVLAPENKYGQNMNMEDEVEIIKTNPLFNSLSVKRSSSLRYSNNIDKNCFIILGIGNDFTYFKEAFDKAKNNNITLIIYTYGDNRALEPIHWNLLNSYQWYSVCVTPLRLISEIFNILSTFDFKD